MGAAGKNKRRLWVNAGIAAAFCSVWPVRGMVGGELSAAKGTLYLAVVLGVVAGVFALVGRVRGSTVQGE
ncbi:hypothetical protein ACG5V6_21480 [Streptomyces chitinivorans]|uniref:Integral membrane protein n=1 Tax=Streptomyces chitinivorans TaxID=1257027 RepID=A0ABW7HY47_9ACTN|nr:hypothetical protein [Streptomyces chitinivorans]MDH2410220.1 hypothetical protein [Streptomyces chitinivorans]